MSRGFPTTMLKNGFAFILFGCWIVVTTLRWPVFWRGLCSPFITVLDRLAASEPHASLQVLTLAEFWLASYVWLGAGLYLAVSLVRPPSSTFTSFAGMYSESYRPGPAFRIGIAGLGLLLLCGAAAPLLAPLDPTLQGNLLTTRMLPPGRSVTVHTASPEQSATGSPSVIIRWEQAVNGILTGTAMRMDTIPDPDGRTMTVILGTDALGRDVLSRLLYGIRVTLGIGAGATALALVMGVMLGILAGLFPGIPGRFILWFTDSLLALPSLFLVLLLLVLFGNSVPVLILALALCGWMGIARLVRGEVLHLREQEFFDAARLLGTPLLKMLGLHVIPNLLPVLVNAALLQFATVILAESALSFLGLGVQPPTPSWGTMLGEALPVIGQAWWLTVFPGMALGGLVLSLHLLAEEFQELLKIS